MAGDSNLSLLFENYRIIEIFEKVYTFKVPPSIKIKFTDRQISILLYRRI